MLLNLQGVVIDHHSEMHLKITNFYFQSILTSNNFLTIQFTFVVTFDFLIYRKSTTSTQTN